ncbi:hypothetical protein B0H13DRAFT_2537577 [Mycena leptocephala]|nr:hypothetical protein B0H13DRAFT_2537577 [Mycena leptocephala]
MPAETGRLNSRDGNFSERVTRSAFLKRKETEGGGETRNPGTGNISKRRRTNNENVFVPRDSSVASNKISLLEKSSVMAKTLAKNKSLRCGPTKKYAQLCTASFPSTLTGSNGSSSLQILASALERLRVPPPERPNTTMTFLSDVSVNELSLTTIDAPGIVLERPTSSGLQTTMGRGRAAPKVSRNPGLPTIIGSPMKSADIIFEKDPAECSAEKTTALGEERERPLEERAQHASGRAAMAARNLSNSVSRSSSVPSALRDNEGMPRRSTRIATTHVTSVPNAIQPLSILHRCIVYVDIVSESGDDSAKSLITDMLKNLGARITQVLGSVGQTLTHIVYKNGTPRTFNRYRALPEPKPLVVGMEWVVRSAENRTYEEETLYLIDMDDMNTTTIKRGRRMLGAEFDDGDGGYTSDGSVFFRTLDDVPPLTMARLRMVGI